MQCLADGLACAPAAVDFDLGIDGSSVDITGLVGLVEECRRLADGSAGYMC